MGTQCLWSDHIWHPWKGCHKVSQGCRNCYMFRTLESLNRNPTVVMRALKREWDLPFRLKSGKVQVCSQSDFFVEDADEWRDEAWEVVRKASHLTYQILTKRPERIARNLPRDWGAGWPHVWLGVTTENQAMADKRIPKLLEVPAARYFISAQPLLEHIDVSDKLGTKKVSLVLSGCESGPGSRHTEKAWMESLQRQCDSKDVRHFLVQVRNGEEQLVRMPFYNGRMCHDKDVYSRFD